MDISQFPPYPGGVTDGFAPGPQRISTFCFFGGLEIESRKMCKMWVWTAPAWSDCMYTLPKNTLEMDLKIMICLIIFETFTEEGQSCCQGMSMRCQGVPGEAKSRCQGMSMGCQGAPRGIKKVPRNVHGVPRRRPGVSKGCQGIQFHQQRWGQGGKPKVDASQMSPRCFQIFPVPPLSKMCPRCPRPGSTAHFDLLLFWRS